MRILMALLFLAGAVSAFAFPAYTDYFSGEVIGTFRVTERGGVADDPVVYLDPSNAPVGVILRLESLPDAVLAGPSGQRTEIRLTVERDGVPVDDTTVTFAHLSAMRDGQFRPTQPRPEKLVLRLDPVIKGDHRFTVRLTGRQDMPILAVDLILRSNMLVSDDRVQPAGFLMLVIGGVGLVLLRRADGAKAAVPQRKPPERRTWGRG